MIERHSTPSVVGKFPLLISVLRNLQVLILILLYAALKSEKM